MDTWASSVAAGWLVRYVQVMPVPSAVARADSGKPPATTVRAFGAVTRKVILALSDGWSLQGNTRWAASAWLAMARPPGVLTHPLSARSDGSLVCPTVIR